MDPKLKKLMQELGNAINESLSNSEAIAEAIEAIKRTGYDVFIVLEAAIGFNERVKSDREQIEKKKTGASPSKPPIEFRISEQDLKLFPPGSGIKLDGE